LVSTKNDSLSIRQLDILIQPTDFTTESLQAEESKLAKDNEVSELMMNAT